MAAGPDTVGRVHSWDTSVGVDGPGTRFVVFTAGCPLRCLYCHNPDTWAGRSGQPTRAADMLALIDREARFLRVAGGGVTVSGGEPLLQPDFCEAILAGCRERGLHTALDTSGYLGERAGDRLLAATDLVLLDIKSWDPAVHRALTGVEVGPTLAFARRLADRGQPVWVRFVLVPGWTDGAANVAGLARFCAGLGNIERVDVLPYHTFGAPKYAALGLPYPLGDTPPPDAALLDRVRDQFAAAGLTAC
jgi:pyruvate formate lyase activating enzyme